MNPQTLKLFGTLEVLNDYGELFLWDTEQEGEFDLWNLLVSEHFVQSTDLELAIAHWQAMEVWGSPTDLADYEYAPLRSERKDESWSEASAAQRQALYQQLQSELEQQLNNLQTYRLAIPGSRQYEWDHPDFSVHLIVGQYADPKVEQNVDQWLCLVPTVPDQVGIQPRRSRRDETNSSPVSSAVHPPLPTELSQILTQLSPIPLFGYYHGGYNYDYHHQLFPAVAPTQNQAIVQALIAARMLNIEGPSATQQQSHPQAKAQKSPQAFMQTTLESFQTVGVSFWDLGYEYTLGKTPAGDWLGQRSLAEFEYNP